MLSIKITIILLLCALIVWLISILPPAIASTIYDLGSFLFGLFGFLFLLFVLALFLFYKIQF